MKERGQKIGSDRIREKCRREQGTGLVSRYTDMLAVPRHSQCGLRSNLSTTENEDPVAVCDKTAAADSGTPANTTPRYLAPLPTVADQTATRKLRIHSVRQICWRVIRGGGGNRSLGPERSWVFALCILSGRTLFFSHTQTSS